MQIAQGLDWGTIPAWFSAILGGVSTVLALHIILRDRKKAERADVAQVVCWTNHENTGYTTHVVNTSDRAIHDVCVQLWFKGSESAGRSGEVIEPAFIQRMIKPGEDAQYVSERFALHTQTVRVLPWAVQFRDSVGQRWVRDLRTGRLHAQRKRPPLFSRYTLMHWREVRSSRRMIKQITNAGL